MEESKGHRKHDRQLKEEAVMLVTEGNNPVAEVARGLGIHATSRGLRQNLLRTWKKKYKEDPSGSFPGKGHLKPQDEEFKRLQRIFSNILKCSINLAGGIQPLDICLRYLLI